LHVADADAIWHIILSTKYQVCQFASVEVADSMGTKRQGIHKDMDMNRMDAQGKVIAPFIFDEAKKIEYEELVEETEGPAEAPCKVRCVAVDDQ
jgi:hypothetical protein